MSTTSMLFLRRGIQVNLTRRFHLTIRAQQQQKQQQQKERYFTKKHEWVQLFDNGNKQNEIRVGISDYAQQALGDVVYCELPVVGTKFKRDDSFATLESVKAVSDCYMPIDGEISAINEKLKNEADLINKSPYEHGWLVQAIIDSQQKKDIPSTLMDEKKYKEFLASNKDASDH